MLHHEFIGAGDQTGGGGGWLPTDEPSLTWEYDLGDPVTLFQTTTYTDPVDADGQAINSIHDKSPNSHHMVNNGGGPIWRPEGGPGGGSAAECTASERWITGAGGENDLTAGATFGTAFKTDAGADRGLFGYYQNADNYFHVSLPAGGTAYLYSKRAGSFNLKKLGDPGHDVWRTLVFTIGADKRTITPFIDGVAQTVQVAGSDLFNNGLGYWTFGQAQTPNNWFNGHTGGFIRFDSVLSNIEDIHNYLARA